MPLERRGLDQWSLWAPIFFIAQARRAPRRRRERRDTVAPTATQTTLGEKPAKLGARPTFPFALELSGRRLTARRLAFYEQGRYKAGDWNASAAGPESRGRLRGSRLRSFCLLPSQEHVARGRFFTQSAPGRLGKVARNATRRRASCARPGALSRPKTKRSSSGFRREARFTTSPHDQVTLRFSR